MKSAGRSLGNIFVIFLPIEINYAKISLKKKIEVCSHLGVKRKGAEHALGGQDAGWQLCA